jgi:outer membrane protein assembly factor BamB
VGMMVCTDKLTVVAWRQSRTVFRYHASSGTIDSFKLDDPTQVYPALHCSNLVVSSDSVRYQIDANDWQVRQEQSTASPHASPLFDTDRLYVTGSGGLQAIDIGAELLWTHMNDRLLTGIASTENTVYAIESNARGGQLMALDAATGDVRWKTDTIGETYTDPVVSRHVYVTNATGRIFALDRNDGNVVWTHQTGTRDSRFTVPAVGDGVLFVSDEGSGSIRAVGESNGETLWETPIYRNESRKEQTGTLFAPLLTEENVLVSAGPAGLVALGREEGQRRYQNASRTVVSPLAVSHKTIYAATPSGLMLFEPSD